MSTRKPNPIIEEFIEIYRSEPCLWQVRSKDYHNRDLREAAYGRLVTKLKEIDPAANKSSVVKKINNLRSNVRKEKKKRDVSMKSGAGMDDVYTPKLWYYDMFDFLGDIDVTSTSSSNLDDEDGSEIGEDGTEDPDKQNCPSDDSSTMPPNPESSTQTKKCETPLRPNIAKKRKNEELTTDVLVSVRDHFKKPPSQEDRYDLLGKSIACRIRALEKRQRLIVEKRINDILFEADMGMLDTPTPSYNYDYTSSSSSRTQSPSPNSNMYDLNAHEARLPVLGTQEEPTNRLINYFSGFSGTI